MMRKCHLNTCRSALRRRTRYCASASPASPSTSSIISSATAEARLPHLQELGRVDKLDMVRAIDHWKAKGIDLSRLLNQEPVVAPHNCERQQHHLDKALDNELIAEAQPALEERQPAHRAADPQCPSHCRRDAVGEVARRYGHPGLPQDTIGPTFRGNAGQSFGAFSRARHHIGALRRRQRLHRQGLSAGARSCASRPRYCEPTGKHHHRQHRAVRRDRRRGVFRRGCR